MRVTALASAFLLLSAASTACAQVAATPASSLLRALQFDTQVYQRQSVDGEAQPYNLRADPSRDARLADGGLSLGPFKMDIDSAVEGSAVPSRDGRVARFAHVHLDDVRVMGGNISGTFDGRSATLRLSWPMGR
jgi:hypothetical protein